MPISYPTSLDNLTNPTGTDGVAVVDHASQHANANDAIEALEVKVGANSSAVNTSHDYKLSDVTTGNKAESSANKETSALDTSTTKYPCNNVVKSAVDGKMANPMTTAGDTIYGGASGVPTRLGVGTAGQVLTVNSGATAPEWQSGVTASSTTTFTNKRINPRLVTAASYTTDTGTSLNIATCDQFEITAQAGALKFNNPGGTPTGGQKLIIRIKDDGTARALTYDTQFRAMGNALPATTTISKTMYMGFIFNSTDTKWDLVALSTEA